MNLSEFRFLAKVPKVVTNYRCPGRNPLDRKAMARAFVAKVLYRHPTTSDLIRALNSAENLRRICGFVSSSDIPSESTFSRAFGEFAASELNNLEPYAYLRYIFARLPVALMLEDYEALLPWNVTAEKLGFAAPARCG